MSWPEEEMLSPAQRASNIKRLYQKELMEKAYVVGVGVGYKKTEGQLTNTIALVVMVTRKLPKELLPPEDILPEEIDGIPVDVQEVGELGAF